MIPKIISDLALAILRFIQAEDDDTAQEEALMQAQEAIKRELDRRKFGKGAES